MSLPLTKEEKQIEKITNEEKNSPIEKPLENKEIIITKEKEKEINNKEKEKIEPVIKEDKPKEEIIIKKEEEEKPAPKVSKIANMSKVKIK